MDKHLAHREHQQDNVDVQELLVVPVEPGTEYFDFFGEGLVAARGGLLDGEVNREEVVDVKDVAAYHKVCS